MNTKAPQVKRTRIIFSNAIGLLCRYGSDWFNRDLIHSVERAARTAGYNLVLSYSNGDLFAEAEELAGLAEQCCGVIIVPTLDDEAAEAPDLIQPFHRLERERYPLVLIEHGVPGCRLPLCSPDHREAGRLATKFLVSDCECEKVMIVPEPSSSIAQARIEGHIEYMREVRGPSFVPLLHTSIHHPFHYAHMWDADVPKQLVEATSNGRFVGIITMDERTAANVNCRLYGELHSQAIIVTFGGHDYVEPTNHGYMLVKEDYFKTGTDALEVLLELIESKRRDFGKPLVADLSRRSPLTQDFTLLSDRRIREFAAREKRTIAKLRTTKEYYAMMRTKEDEEEEELVRRFQALDDYGDPYVTEDSDDGIYR
jgi:DNA-binding LacI/PurR family transcriptional regulator